MTSDRVVSILLSILLLTSAVAVVEIVQDSGVATAASADTVVVNGDGTGDARTIQQGINQAGSGDTVLVESGTYNETVVVNKSVKVVANGSVILDGEGKSGTAFLINNKTAGVGLSNILIKGFEIRNYSSTSTLTGHGIAVTETSLTNVTIKKNHIHDVDRHGILVYNQGGTQQTIRIRNNSIEDVKIVGIAAINDGGTQTDITIRQTSISNASSTAFGLRVLGSGSTSNVSIENVSLSQSANAGIYVNLTQTGSLDNLSFKRVLVNQTGGPGLFLDVNPNATSNTISLRESVFQNNTGGGLVVSPSTPAGDLEIHRSIIRDNDNGVVNHNASGLVDARYNYWGNSTGAGSPDPANPLEDPVTGKLANGDGDTVSESGTSGVANVRFSPSICGKTSNDSQRLKPDFNQTVTQTIAGEELTVDASNCVGLWAWERSILPFRTDPSNAVTKVLLPDTYLRVDGEDVSINRDYISVYEPGQQITLEFRKVTGARTDRFAGEEVQVIFVYVNGSVNTEQAIEDMFNTSIDTTTGNVTVDVDGVEVVEARDLGTLDGNGEITTSFTPSKSGDYVAVLATVETGDGFEASGDGNASFNVLNDSSTIIGVEPIFVQKTSSSVTPNKTSVVQGHDVAFEADSKLSASQVSHFLIAYNKSQFEDQTVIITETDAVNTSTGVLLSVNGTSDGDSFFLKVNVSDDGVIQDVETGGALNDIDVNSTLVENGNAVETLTLTLGEAGDLPEDASTTYQFVHVAFNESNPSIRSTSKGTVEVTGPTVKVIDATLNRTEIQQGQAINVTATLENPGASSATKTVRVFLNGTEAANKTITLSAGETLTENFTLRFATSGTFEVTVENVLAGTVTVQAAPEEEEPPAGGGGGGREEPSVTFRVVNTASGQSIIVRDAQTGSVFDVPVNLAGAGVTITNIRIDHRFQDPKYTVQIQNPRTNPPSGTRALDKGQGIAYFKITRLDIKNINIRSVTFTFTIDPAALPEGASPEDIRMYRFRGGQWRELETTHLGGNQYQAVSPGFSVFAVGVVSPAEETPTETETPTTPTETPSTPTETPVTPSETPTTPPETPGGFFQTLLLGLLVGFLLIALILISGYYAYREGYLDEYVQAR